MRPRRWRQRRVAFVLGEKCVWNILVLGLDGLEEEGTAPAALPQELCVCRERRGDVDDVGCDIDLD